MAMPEEVRNLCRLADISSKSLLLQVVRQDTPEKMTALVEKIASQGGATRQQLREAAAKPKAGRPKHYVFAYRPPTKAFNLKLSFTKSRASRDEIIDALEAHHPRPPQGQAATVTSSWTPAARTACADQRVERVEARSSRLSAQVGRDVGGAHRRIWSR